MNHMIGVYSVPSLLVNLSFKSIYNKVPSFIVTNNNNNYYLGLDQLQFANLLNLKLKKKKIFEVSIITKLISETNF